MTDRTMVRRPLKTASALAAYIAGTMLLLACPGAGSAQASGVADLHDTWRGCLTRTFGFQSALTSRTLAADIALRTCRGSEMAYLSALSTSPLVDEDDVARVRPALLERARGWLLSRQTSRPL